MESLGGTSIALFLRYSRSPYSHLERHHHLKPVGLKLEDKEVLIATLPWLLQQMLVTINILQSQVTSQEVSPNRPCEA